MPLWGVWITQDGSRSAWQRLYAKHGLQYGGRGDIRLLEPHLKVGMTVLDAGCGDGKTTELLAKECDVVGADFSREALISLRSQRRHADAQELVECNLLSLPFEREKFDAISCVHALSHMIESERLTVAKELSRVLRPKGHIFLEVFGRNDLRYGEGEQIEEATFIRGNGIRTHYFREGEIASMFPELLTISEVIHVRRISLGAVAGKREVLKVLLRKKR